MLSKRLSAKTEIRASNASVTVVLTNCPVAMIDLLELLWWIYANDGGIAYALFPLEKVDEVRGSGRRADGQVPEAKGAIGRDGKCAGCGRCGGTEGKEGEEGEER